MPIAPLYEQPYDSRYRTQRLSDLARLRANVVSEADQRAASLNAGLVADLGRTIGGTLADIGRIKASEDARKRAEGKADARLDTLKMVSGLPADQQAGELMAAGLPEDAAKAEARAEHLADRADKQEQTALSAIRQRIGNAKTVLGKGAALAQAAQEKPEMWGELRPQLADLAASIDPQLASFIPEDNNPEAIGALVSSVTELAKRYADTERKVKAADAALTQGKKLADVTKAFGEILVDLPDEQHDGILKAFAAEGVPEAVLTGATTAAASLRAAKNAKDDKPRSDFDAYLRSIAEEKGRALKPAEVVLARTQWEASGRAPKSDHEPTGTSQAQKAAAERWKQGQLASLEERFRADEIGEDELNREKWRIQTSYLDQIGVSPDRTGAYAGLTPPQPGGQPPPQHAAAPPAAPMGASPAAAAPAPAPARPMPKVGDVVTVRGQKVKITAIDPNGKISGVPVP